LIIDDEPLVAKTLKRLLRTHEVETAHTPLEGLEIICSSSHDLIFCDLMMPEMSGAELFSRVTKRAPAQCESFVFITGGAFSVESEHFLNTSGKRVLYKPFNRKTLRAIIDDAEAKCGA